MSENEPESVDRRMVFRNVQLLKPEDRVANSQILQFISTNANIGNYMPVRAIQDMLGQEADVWNMHRPADWDFINNNYKAIVIGGAGLLARPFNHFWVACAEHCKLPIIVWGIGTCIIDGLAAQDTMCDVEAVNSVFKRALMVNVRDEVTAELYGAGIENEISITACPTIAYLRDFDVQAEAKTLTLSVHPELIDEQTHDRIQQVCEAAGYNVLLTKNVQTPEEGLEDIIRYYFCRSELVVSTRLHGAITAYGLGIPYLALPGDEKAREFQRLYGGGQLFDNTDALAELLAQTHVRQPLPNLGEILAFGERARVALAAIN